MIWTFLNNYFKSKIPLFVLGIEGGGVQLARGSDFVIALLESGTHSVALADSVLACVAQDGLNLMTTFLPQPPAC